MSSQFSVKLRLLLSFSPTVASSMSSVAALGIYNSLSFSLYIYMYVYICFFFATNVCKYMYICLYVYNYVYISILWFLYA
jgi:hypothetical protein